MIKNMITLRQQTMIIATMMATCKRDKGDQSESGKLHLCPVGDDIRQVSTERHIYHSHIPISS